MKTVKIEKGIPFKKQKQKGTLTDIVGVIKSLKASESFYWPGNRNTLSSVITLANLLLDAKFVTSKEGNGIRVWRIA